MPKVTSLTKYFQVAQELRVKVRGMSPGRELPTVRELKEEFNVSQGTIVKAVSQLRAEGVLERPAGKKRLVVAEKHDHTVRNIMIVRPDWPSPDFDAVVRCITQACKQRGWGINLTTYGSLRNVEMNRATGINDAAVLLPNSESFPDHLRDALRRPAKPTVLVVEPIKNLGVPTVNVDGRQCGRLAVEHLADLGHQKVLAVLSEPPSAMALERIAGWRDAMTERQLTGEVDALLVNCGTKPGELSIDVAYSYFSAWMKRSHPEFTAIFCDCWTGALAVKRVLRELKLSIPEDISVIAYSGEGSIGPFLNPPLTAIEVDMESYGSAIAEQLEQAMRAESGVPKAIRIQPRLQVRESTGPVATEPKKSLHLNTSSQLAGNVRD